VKSTGSYINSSFARMEANDHGYAEAILLNEQGMVCEGTGENIFVVRDEIIVTPPVSDGVLEGITRDTVIALAQDLDFDVIEASLTRADLYIADEIFFTGSAAEVVPVRSVDHRPIGDPGPITLAIQAAYFNAVRGKDAEYEYWLERV
jgi:branched-chain amino acid aminotransferase